MFYIHQSTCISAQQTFGEVNLEQLLPAVDNQMQAKEPGYQGVPPGQLRRMGKAVRMGVGAGLPLLMQHQPNGVLIGTANGGIEDSIKFLNQIIEYKEGTLTPTAFVQSTYNAIAGQLGMIAKNKGYNITHVHRGLAFENAALDAAMLLKENPDHSYLLGAVDEISPHNYHMEVLDDCYKTAPIDNKDLYTTNTHGAIRGEGSAMFIVNNKAEGAVAKVTDIRLLNTGDDKIIAAQLKAFLQKNNAASQPIELLLSGENGDNRYLRHYETVEDILGSNTTVARYKHAIGEFQTASALALWIACRVMQTQAMPDHFVKKQGAHKAINRILMYNNYRGLQDSFILVERVN